MRKPSFFAALLAAIFLLIMPLTAAASSTDDPEWLSFSEDNDGTVFYIQTIDVLGFTPGGTDNRFWVKMDHSKDPTVRTRKTMIYFSMDCVRNTTKVLSIITYFPSGKSDDLGSDMTPKYIAPDTHLAIVEKALCPK